MKLSLHRIGKKPDWSLVPVARRNRWQRLAHRTGGIVTPANAVTAVGFGLALVGIGELVARHFWWAIGLLAVGRLLDIVDGVVADRTGTKSALGELLDATVDKIITVLTVVGLFIAQTAPLWLLAVFIAPHLIISLMTIVGRVRHAEQHPSRLGKTAMLLAWIAIPLILLINALQLALPNPLVDLTYVFALVAAGFGFTTAASYLPKSARP